MHVVENELRRSARTSLPLSIGVEVTLDHEVAWTEQTQLRDVSPLGAGFTVKRRIEEGRLVQLRIPMPQAYRRYDLEEKDYKVWGLVRRCIGVSNLRGLPDYSVGVAFIGKSPPSNHLRHPVDTYDLSFVEPADGEFWDVSVSGSAKSLSHHQGRMRRSSRLNIPETITLETIDAEGNVLASEATVTDNISREGASVLTQMDLGTGSFLRTTSLRHNVSLISIVRGSSIGSDGIARFHIEFIDELFPIEMLAF